MRISCMALMAALFLTLVAGCGGPAADEVVVYTSVDEPVARQILQEFERQTGLRVRVQTDREVTKTAGLAERLIAEKANPRADVYWGNEVFYTIRLTGEGVLAEYRSPAALDIPDRYKDPRGRWAGTALRVRVIARTTADPGKSAASTVRSLADLTRSELKGRICMATPAAGTTGGHVAAMYTLWGRERFERFFQALKANDVRLVGGNSVVTDEVGKGVMWVGLTDNDDVDASLREGGRLEMVLPDQDPDGIGTLLIPCTVGLVAGGPRPDNGRRLIDYLLSRQVEQRMIDAKFARYSVFAELPREVRPMDVDYGEAAANLLAARDLALRIIEGR